MDAADGPLSSVGAKHTLLVLRVDNASVSSGVLQKHQIVCYDMLNATADHHKLVYFLCSHGFISMKLTGHEKECIITDEFKTCMRG